MSRDIAESHKFRRELSPIGLTTLASNRPRPKQEETLTEKDRRTGMDPWQTRMVYLLPIFILCLFIWVTSILISLVQRITQCIDDYQRSMGFGAVLFYFCICFLIEWRNLMQELMS